MKDNTKALIAAVATYTFWGFSFMASKVCLGVTSAFVLLAVIAGIWGVQKFSPPEKPNDKKYSQKG